MGSTRPATNNGVSYGKWTHFDGWSGPFVDYIRGREQAEGKAEKPVADG